MKSGATITELLLVLTLIAILATLAAPAAARSVDIVAVHAARETVFGLATRTRSAAMERGGATLIIDRDSNTVVVTDADGITIEHDDVDADITIDGTGSSRVALRYDAFGIGRMTSRTIRFRRGAAQAELVFSAYGRVKR